MFNTELTYQNQKSFVCNIEDFEQIKEIAELRTKIRDQDKHEEYNEKMMSYVKGILTEQTEEKIVLGTKDVNSGKLLCYTIVLIPEDSGFYFAMVAETRPNNNTVASYDNSGAALMHMLLVEIALKKKIFNGFTCMKLNSMIPAMMMYLKSNVTKNRMDSRIHAVVHPNKSNLTRIEKLFMDSGFGLYDRSRTSYGIIHFSILPNYRTEYL